MEGQTTGGGDQDLNIEAIAPDKPRKRRPLRRFMLWSLAGLLVVLVIVAAAAPTVAGWMAPGMVARAVRDRINGTATVERVSLAWFGSQQIGPVVVKDQAGTEVARLEMSVSRGLWGLGGGAIGLGSLDAGEIAVAGKATIVREADGTINLGKILKPSPEPPKPTPPGAPGKPIKLPRGLAATLVIDKLDVTFVDRSAAAPPGAEAIRIANIKGGGQLAAGKPATFKLSASAWYGPSENAATNAAGTLSMGATVDRLIDSTGTLTPDQAKFDLTLEARDASMLLADAFAGTTDAMARGFGDRLTLAIKAAGTAKDATADLTATAQGLSADLGLRYADDVLSASRAGTLRAQGAGLVPLVPGLNAAIDEQQSARITTWPEVTIGVQSLRIKVPAGGARPDLRGGSLALTVKTTELLGTVMAPSLDEGDGELSRRAFRLAPFTLSVNAPDLGGPVKVHADTAARLSDSSAGNLQLDVTAEGLLDEHGAPVAGPPQKLNGRLVVKEIATALGQPLVEAMGLDLPRDLGPRLDVVVAAAARAEPTAAGGDVPRTNVDVTVRSGKLQTTAALLLDETGLRGRDMPDAPAVQVSLASASQIAARFVNNLGTGARASGQGSLTIAVSGLHVPLAQGTRSPDLANASATATVAFGGLTIAPPPPPRPAGAAAPPAGGTAPIAVERFGVTATLAPSQAPAVAIDSAMKHGGTPFAIKGALALEGLMRTDAHGRMQLTPDAALPVGTITLEGIPTALASLMPAQTAEPGKPALDVPGLIRDAVGPSVNVSLETVIAEARSDRLNFRLGIDSAGVNGRINGGLLPDRIDVARSEVRATLTPALAESMLATFAPTLAPRPRLAAPSTLVLAVEPTRLPFVKGRRFAPDFAAAGDLDARVSMDGRLVVENLAITGAEGKPRDIGPTALDGFEATFGAPLPALLAGTGKSGTATVVLKSNVLAGPAGAELASLGRLDVDAKADFAAGTPAGPATAMVKLTEFATDQIDRLLAQPGLLAGALGPAVSLDAGVEADLPRPGSAAEAGAAVYERVAVTVTPSAAMLKTEQPLKAVLTPGRVTVDTPMVLAWRMDPPFADRFVLGIEPAGHPSPPGAQPAPAPAARFAAPSEFRIAIYRLGLASGEAPMKPGVFGVDAAVEAPALTLALAGGAPAKFDDVKLRLQAGGEKQEPGTAGFSLRMLSESTPVEISGGVYGLHDGAGVPTPDTARVTAQVRAQAFPTAVVDGLARQRGLLIEALGPTVTLEADASGLSMGSGGERGKLSATFTSPRATAKLEGGVGDGVFIAQGPVNVQFVEITTALGQRLVTGLPMVGTFEKRAEDGPASLTATNLRVPVDGDLRKLNGDVVLNLGMVRFDTSKTLAGLLRGLGQREQGVLGRRVSPFRATFKDGVMSYDNYTLPLGEFSVDIRGEVDFAERTLDLVTYIPLGALSDEAAGAFNTGLGRLLSNVPMLDKATMMPFRTRGSFERSRTEPDPGLFLKEFGGAINPLNIIKPGRDDRGGGG